MNLAMAISHQLSISVHCQNQDERYSLIENCPYGVTTMFLKLHQIAPPIKYSHIFIFNDK